MVTINTKHHQAGKLALDGDHLTVNGHRSDYIAKARREAGRAAGLLTTALAAVGRDELAAALRVRPVLAIVGARVLIRDWADGVAVLMPWSATVAAETLSRPGPSDQHERSGVDRLPGYDVDHDPRNLVVAALSVTRARETCATSIVRAGRLPRGTEERFTVPRYAWPRALGTSTFRRMAAGRRGPDRQMGARSAPS